MRLDQVLGSLLGLLRVTSVQIGGLNLGPSVDQSRNPEERSEGQNRNFVHQVVLLELLRQVDIPWLMVLALLRKSDMLQGARRSIKRRRRSARNEVLSMQPRPSRKQWLQISLVPFRC